MHPFFLAALAQWESARLKIWRPCVRSTEVASIFFKFLICELSSYIYRWQLYSNVSLFTIFSVGGILFRYIELIKEVFEGEINK
ncbi:hypothetical protein PICMEDRAFT_79928 [Pichia membranifaciens NRRL Y-2026]|uniref:Uncharacterized protein n=1 Tax=Pichia membranifaciens NRRL Y-2026 TaxID=763406 RepID=A0A1E3NQI5_9ASCO|nr:hypothetical protein PICMEDRAFT_79928 [Pichia membranifaciens NRRL Y-2026]ODQ48312.1 hypothetical protein PICMEDRAFT_79928 [Pichia membranifaciens NRRL Y-2026]